MKNLLLSLLLFAIIFSASAQEVKHNVAFKSYVTFIKSNNPSGNTNFYGFTNFQVGGPAFALAITRGKGNYHQIELCDLKLDINPNYFPGKSTHFSVGFRYAYNVCLLKTSNGKLKTFIGFGAHLLTNYLRNRFADPTEDPYRYTTINAELNVAPVISYSFCQHFSMEANFPLTFFGFTEELYPYDSGGPSRQDNPFLGPQYFYGRIGLSVNL